MNIKIDIKNQKAKAVIDRLLAQPVELYGAVLGGMVVLDTVLGFILPLSILSFWPQFLMGSLMIMAGGSLTYIIMRAFETHHLDIMGTEPQDSLITDGIYRVSRNPLYIALAVIYAGVAIVFDAPLAMLALCPLMIYIGRVVVPREEAALSAKFGEQYETYCIAVRPWI